MDKKIDLSRLYIVDFVKKTVHRKNITIFIYLLLNVVIITLMMLLFEENLWLCLLYSVLLYCVTATIALSPVGEWVFRLFNGCKKIEDPAILNRLEPLFMEVKERTKTKHSDIVIDDGITLYIREDNDINAFAMGRRTVCVTYGLLSLNDEQIKAVLGHEFGHLATHDTDLTLLITIGNFIITAMVIFIRVIVGIYNILISMIAALAGDEGAIVDVLRAIASFVTTLCINGLMWLWTQLGILLVMKASREAEFEADAFSCDLGYSEALLSFFRILRGVELRVGKEDRGNIFAALAASHPDTDKRIARIKNRDTLATKQ